MWRNINSLINSCNKDNQITNFLTDGLLIDDPKVIANELNCFFTKIAQKTISNIKDPGIPFHSYLNFSHKYTFDFHTVDRDTVSKAINELNPKATTDSIGISAELIKICKF